jgi:transcriptional regulator with AAA-type ATPase domain
MKESFSAFALTGAPLGPISNSILSHFSASGDLRANKPGASLALGHDMKWQVRILDPSGETRIVRLQGPVQGGFTIGKSASASILLHDERAPETAAVISVAPLQEATEISSDHALKNSSPFWLHVAANNPAVLIGDLSVRDAQIPAGVPISIGDSSITLEPLMSERVLPSLPQGMRPWLTQSEEGRELLWMARKAAATPLSLYIAGETGTGKEVLAHLLHAWSDRSSGPFVPLHCGALALSLAESELFGHVKGAFTGAHQHRPGALMQAHGGTLFLDEVGDLPLDIQVKLLRFLENGEIRHVGSDHMSHADVRLLCATHHPLNKLVEAGKFRRDLFYRLASVTLEIPALRDRPADIDLLALRFARDLGRQISPQAMLRLKAHLWPGNVRELRHAVERASGLAGPFSHLLDSTAFDFLLTPENISLVPELEFGSACLTMHEMERVMLIKALKLSRGNRAEAARILKVARSTLFDMLKRHKLKGPRLIKEKAFIAADIG